MVAWKLSSLLLLSLRALTASAEAKVVEMEQESAQMANLKVSISASFPQSEIFGVKLINGHATQAVFSIKNEEPAPISLAIIGGSIVQNGVPEPQVLRNLTTQKYSVEVPAGQSETVTYSFSTEMHPQDVRLQLVAVLTDAKNAFYTVSAFNETVTVVEAPISIFDPQTYVSSRRTSPGPLQRLPTKTLTRVSSIFLYLVLLGAFGGTLYFVYNTWITTLFPQKKRGGKGGERAKKSSQGTKKVEPAEQVAVDGADGPAVTSSKFDASWIPAAHLQRPEAKRVRSGTPKTKPKA
ncbi:hypothetical protein P154DRAFT_485430 [Amniculicola lignicola CBS 123094]|uniref:Translocon-associated protein subunit alpha n=1 Tax=Amniculicola lignicola CBS 123094 TaxID=1392246 RepID=A0A6A5WQZ0_9PLEO|nr:hypothetical protein P154DRAFT_485430 [Amniculicola lignicola CBS 123094]